jgi:hypothetical protein
MHSALPSLHRGAPPCTKLVWLSYWLTAAGMGVDKATLGAVVHLQMPRSLEDYVQQVSGGGRRLAPGVAAHTYRCSVAGTAQVPHRQLSTTPVGSIIGALLVTHRCTLLPACRSGELAVMAQRRSASCCWIRWGHTSTLAGGAEWASLLHPLLFSGPGAA